MWELRLQGYVTTGAERRRRSEERRRGRDTDRRRERDFRDIGRGEDKGSPRKIKKNSGREMKQFNMRATADRAISPLMVIIC